MAYGKTYSSKTTKTTKKKAAKKPVKSTKRKY